MSSSLMLNASCKFCKCVHESVVELLNHEQVCPLRKMLALEHAANGAGECVYCKKEFKPKQKHECKERVGMLVNHLMTKQCSEWLKGYIMQAVLGFMRDKEGPGAGDEDPSVVISRSLITLSKADA